MQDGTIFHSFGANSPTVQGDTPEWEAPSLPVHQPDAANIPAEMATIHINVSYTQWVYYCWTEEYCKEPSTPLLSKAHMCAVTTWPQNCQAPCS